MSDLDDLDGEDLAERVFDDYEVKWPCIHECPCSCWMEPRDD